MNPSSMFGEMSFLANSPTTASILADEDGELYDLEISLVKKMFASDTELFSTFYQFLATQLAKRLKVIIGYYFFIFIFFCNF